MDFNDTPAEASFRKEVRDWLRRNVPTADELAGIGEIQQCKLWQRRKFDAGWACIRWPEQYGGRGASAIEQVIWQQEESKYDLPLGIFDIGIGMAAPTLMHSGNESEPGRNRRTPAPNTSSNGVPPGSKTPCGSGQPAARDLMCTG